MTADYVLVGHLTADLTPNGRIAGGTVSYAARSAAAFGWRVAVVTSAQADEPLIEALRPYADIRVIPADATTTFENIYTSSGRTQYVRQRAQTIHKDDIPADLRESVLVHLAPIADEIAYDVVEAFPNSTILGTLQGWMRQWDESGIVRYKPLMDIPFLRALNIAVFSEEDVVHAVDPIGAELWIAGYVRQTFVTRAEQGGSYFHDGIHESYTSPDADVLDPTGAGDVFASSLLSSLPLVSYDIRLATRIAAALASKSVTRVGLLSAPSIEEVQVTLRDIIQAANGR